MLGELINSFDYLKLEDRAHMDLWVATDRAGKGIGAPCVLICGTWTSPDSSEERALSCCISFFKEDEQWMEKQQKFRDQIKKLMSLFMWETKWTWTLGNEEGMDLRDLKEVEALKLWQDGSSKWKEGVIKALI